MGNFTEIVAGIRLKDSTPKVVLDALEYMTGGSGTEPKVLPDHPLFRSERWRWVLRGSCYYFPVQFSHSKLAPDKISGESSLSVRAAVKNSGDEIDLFFDWIRPYALACFGADKTLLGYSIYEESSTPTLYFKENE